MFVNLKNTVHLAIEIQTGLSNFVYVCMHLSCCGKVWCWKALVMPSEVDLWFDIRSDKMDR